MSTGNLASQAADQNLDLSPYRSKVAGLLNQLNNLNEILTPSALKEQDEAELSVRLDYVEGINLAFEGAQSFIEENERGDSVSKNRMVFISLYFDLKAKLTAIRSLQKSSTLRQFSVDESPSQIASRKAKMPEIQLPKFCGSYSEWTNFFSLFSTVINDNHDLTKLEKFHYLRASLENVALDTIASLELKEENYEPALTLLKNRFDNKLFNFQTHVKEIFTLSSVENGSAAGLRKLSDSMNAHLRALKTLADEKQIFEGFFNTFGYNKVGC